MPVPAALKEYPTMADAEIEIKRIHKEEPFRKLLLLFDGACGPRNPGGKSTYGWVIKNAVTGALIRTGNGVAFPEGHILSTNNSAEWAGLEAALKWVEVNCRGVERLTIKGDSKLVVNQLSRRWRCHKQHLEVFRDSCYILLFKIKCKWEIFWIPRHLNQQCDDLSKACKSKRHSKRRRRRV